MSLVTLVPCADYSPEALAAALEKALSDLGGIERFVKKGTRVALKPNLLMSKRPEEAVTTHPAFARALISLIQKAGGTVTVAESPGGPYFKQYLEGVYRACGYKAIADETGCALNTDLTEAEVNNPGAKYLKKLQIIKPLTDADLVINLPKLKTHGQMVYTGAVKNMFGAIAGTTKIEYHMRMAGCDQFADGLIDIFLSVKPELTIMDAVVGMEGAGPSGGKPKKIGLILASTDAFALDTAAAHVIGLKPEQVPVLRQAAARGLAPKSIEEIMFPGLRPDQARVPSFDIPMLDNLEGVSMSEGAIPGFLARFIKPRPVFRHERCTGCAECVSFCPAKVISMKDKRPYADLSACIRCFCCQELCPSKAVDVRRPPRILRPFLYIAQFVIAALVSKKK